MQATLPLSQPVTTTQGRVLGLSAISDREIMHEWYCMTGAHRNSSRRPTPDELQEAEQRAQPEREKWYTIGRDESLKRFAANDNDAVILNYWHFQQRSQNVHSAYEQGVRDAFALLADRRGLTIPDVSNLTKKQRCICSKCAETYGWEIA